MGIYSTEYGFLIFSGLLEVNSLTRTPQTGLRELGVAAGMGAGAGGGPLVLRQFVKGKGCIEASRVQG